jgi:cell division protein FtsL
MATIAATLPRTRRPRKAARTSSRQMSFPEFYFVKRIDNSRLRREVDPARRRECFGLLVLCSFVFVFGLIFAWQHFQCVQYGYRIEQLKSQKATMEEWNHQLRLERASLADPQRIDRLARRELGLVPPSAQQVIRVGPQGEPESSVLARNLGGMGGAPAGFDRGQ